MTFLVYSDPSKTVNSDPPKIRPIKPRMSLTVQAVLVTLMSLRILIFFFKHFRNLSNWECGKESIIPVFAYSNRFPNFGLLSTTKQFIQLYFFLFNGRWSCCVCFFLPIVNKKYKNVLTNSSVPNRSAGTFIIFEEEIPQYYLFFHTYSKSLT